MKRIARAVNLYHRGIDAAVLARPRVMLAYESSAHRPPNKFAGWARLRRVKGHPARGGSLPRAGPRTALCGRFNTARITTLTSGHWQAA
jgi:hypothetical protein